MISQDTIRQILEAARIEEVIGEFLTLKKSGSNFKGLSPFSNEKTPSFMVSPAKQIFKDFSSGKGGNVVSFLMEHEHFTYPEALRWLADKYGIEIDEGPRTDEDIERDNERESLFIVSKYASETFQKNLVETEEGRNIGLSYFHERGFTDQVIKKFELGYALEGYSAFSDEATQNGYKPEFLTRSGLSIEKDDGRLIDRFRGRVIFPIHNLSGRVIGFGGRILNTEAKTAKYLNSPESLIYHKSKVLYGMYQAKGSIIKKEECYLVEGYTDVISLYQSGIENVVASSGTSLTSDQIRLIKRYTTNVTVLFDGDSAGIKASFRGIDMLLEEGMNVRVVLFPDGEDPDSYARKLDADELTEFLEKQSQDFLRFKTGLLLKDVSNDPIKKSELIKDIVTSISKIPDHIKRSVYLNECANLLEVSESALVAELNKMVKSRRMDRARNKQQQVDANPFIEKVYGDEKVDSAKESWDLKEKEIIRVLLLHGDKSMRVKVMEEEEEKMYEVNVAEFIIRDLQLDELTFRNKVYQNIFIEYADHLADRKIPDDRYFISHPNEEIAKLAVDLISSQYELSENWEEKHNILVATEEHNIRDVVRKCINSYKLAVIEEMIMEKREKLKGLDSDDELLEEIEDIKNLEEIKKLLANGFLGRVVTK